MGSEVATHWLAVQPEEGWAAHGKGASVSESPMPKCQD